MTYSWNIIGQQKQLSALENELNKNQLTHAYLFHGPKHLGKFTIGALFAKMLLCPHQFCLQCQDCRLAEREAHPDLIVMRDEGASIKIDDVRELVAKTHLKPQGRRRVVLIETIERMPAEAQNAFLKTLEEPPGETIFLLTSSKPKNVLPTIVSRVRPYDFSLVADDELQEGLAMRFENKEWQDVLEIAQGRPGLAIRLLTDSTEIMRYREMFYKIQGFLKQNDVLSKFSFVEMLEKDPDQLELFFDLCFLILRKAAKDAAVGMTVFNNRFDLAKIHELFEKLTETRYLVDRNVNKKLALENFFLETEL